MAKTRAQIARRYRTGATPAVGTGPGRPTQRSNGSLVLIAATVASLFLFWYFHLLTLGQMTQLSGGLTMPDLLIGGYDVGHLERLRAAMDDDARGQLSYLHRTAGTLFPLIFAFTWLLLVQLQVGRRWLRWVLWSPVILFVIADLWENVAIDAALTDPSPGAVTLASTLTVLRWALLAISLLAGGAAVFLPGRLRAGSVRGAGSVSGGTGAERVG